MSRGIGTASLIVFTLGLILWHPSFAQGPSQGGSHHSWPVSLETITVTGTVLVDAALSPPMYFLDEDGDAVADYHLAFGPWWYEPASGATRPDEGATVSVVGTVRDFATPPTLIVFEVNGLTWRDPVEYGMHGWNGGAFWTLQGDTLTATGIVMVDTTYFYHHYYLDTDGDSVPEYQLGFGPAWYEPESGATRPSDGEETTVRGIVHDRDGMALLAVYVINGMAWRPFEAPAPWAGRWIHRDHAAVAYAYCVNDTTNRVGFPSEHMGHGMGGRSWPDSAFVQFWRVPPDSLPGPGDPGRFMGFYLNVHDPAGQSMMSRSFGEGHHRMQFEKELHFQFHFSDEELQRRGLSSQGLKVQYWDEEAQRWMDVQGIDLDAETEAVTFSSAELNSYYAIFASSVATRVEGPSPGENPSALVLHQNYPNPFNPATTITYDLPAPQRVVLLVYDALGRRVATLVDAVQPAGRHQTRFDGSGLPSGIYIYRLESGQRSETRRLILLK